MAHITVRYISENKVIGFMSRRFMVDLHFINEEDYHLAVSKGFNKEIWEEKNNNKVIIENGDNCYRCNSILSEDEYGKCNECVSADILFYARIKKESDEAYRKLPWYKKIKW